MAANQVRALKLESNLDFQDMDDDALANVLSRLLAGDENFFSTTARQAVSSAIARLQRSDDEALP